MTIVLLFAGFLGLLFLGVPVAFALGIPAIFYYFLTPAHIPIPFIAHNMTIPLFNYVLIALPAFLLSGRMMNAAGVTDRIFDAAIALVGRFRGGLVHANILASIMFATMSGTAVGDAGGLGPVQMRMMTKAGYRKAVAAGVSAASPIVGPIIPPSVAMVILGASAEISIGRLFLGGVFPGLMLGLALMVNVALRARFTTEGRSWPIEKIPLKQTILSFGKAIPPLFCPIIILGSIILGIVTPTEAAILAINYAILLGIFYRELTLKKFWKTMEEAIVSIGIFMYIIAIASFFVWIVIREGLPMVIRDFLTPIIYFNPTIALLLIFLFLLILGTCLDVTPAILLLAPILIPIVRELGIDVVHFGVFMTMALCIGIVTPPFGICLFVMSDVAQISVKDVTKEAIRYLPAMIIVVLLVIFFPQIILWLPNRVFG